MSLEEKLGKGWFERLSTFMGTKAQWERGTWIAARRRVVPVFPSPANTFRAFKLTPYESVKVVVLGQDPYHDGSANGLAFSTTGYKTPSLRKILEGMEDDLAIGHFLEQEHDWEYLARQGVLLLNTALTVEKGKPLSHAREWMPFTAEVLRILSSYPSPLVFLLWGKPAQETAYRYGALTHHCIACEHPAYAARQSRPWEHKNCFSRCNDFLDSRNIKRIIW